MIRILLAGLALFAAVSIVLGYVLRRIWRAGAVGEYGTLRDAEGNPIGAVDLGMRPKDLDGNPVPRRWWE